MAIPSRQIGQSSESNILWNISKQLEKLTAVSAVMGPSSIISQTVTCGVLNKVPSEDAVCQALAFKQAVLVSGVNISSINGNDLTAGGNIIISGGSSMIVVYNYAALPAPASVTGLFYWCENAQGTAWLPGPIGGTYYPVGAYYSNGTTWEYAQSPYEATQSQVNAGAITDRFVAPATLKNSTQWDTKQNITTATSPITISTGASPVISTLMNTNRLIGRTTASPGVMEEIIVSTGLNLSGGTLTAVSNISSVGLSMPAAFQVTNSPLTAAGTLAVTAVGAASQYIRGDGQLASFPDVAGGGGGQVYYCNGGTSQGTISGSNFYQLSTAAVISTSANFTSGTVNDVAFANFITDIGKPTQETVPAGVWIFQCYLSASATNVLQVYATVEVYTGSSFVVLATSLVEVITNGTTVDLYTFTCAVPEYTPLTTTDRIAIRFYPKNLSGGNTITLYTQNSNLSSIQTTFTTGIAALNALTASAQYFQVGTTGSNFNIDSTTTPATHIFNIPSASASNRGLLTSTDYNTFSGKQTGSTNLTSLSALNYVSTSFVKMTATGTFFLDTNVYAATGGNNAWTGTNSFSNITTFTGNIVANGFIIQPTELGYLDGAVSNIQAQLNNITNPMVQDYLLMTGLRTLYNY